MYQRRQHEEPWDFGTHPIYDGWPRIPDTQLPEPWSCDWSSFAGSLNWYDVQQEIILKQYGRELAGFVPALYVPWCHCIGHTVLSPPGGAGTYHVLYHETPDRDGYLGIGGAYYSSWMGNMHRFEGAYASLEHFVRTADWNRLEAVPYRSPVSYDCNM